MNNRQLFISALDAIQRGMSFDEWAEGNDSGEVNNNIVWVCAEQAEGLIVEARDVSNYTFSEYQRDAGRTINHRLPLGDVERHAVFGMCGEVGELQSLYQKAYQGHEFDELHAEKEVGDLLWFVAEYCTVMGWNMGDVAELNIDKLRARYPEGFDTDKSKNRQEGDI